MTYFVNKLELNNQKYQLDGTVGEENYKGTFLFPVN